MNATDIQKLLDDTKKREDEVRKDREALERVSRLLNLQTNGHSHPNQTEERAEHTTPHAVLKISFSDAIRNAVRAQEGNFTIREILAYLDNKYPSQKARGRVTTLSAILGSFKDKHLRVVSAGRGTPSVYQKI